MRKPFRRPPGRDRAGGVAPGTGALPAARGQDSVRPATPEPRVLCAFDSEDELKAWRVEDPYKPISFTLTAEAGEFKEGTGAAKIRTERDPDYTTGALILDVGKIDEKRGHCIYFATPVTGDCHPPRPPAPDRGAGEEEREGPRGVPAGVSY